MVEILKAKLRQSTISCLLKPIKHCRIWECEIHVFKPKQRLKQITFTVLTVKQQMFNQELCPCLKKVRSSSSNQMYRFWQMTKNSKWYTIWAPRPKPYATMTVMSYKSWFRLKNQSRRLKIVFSSNGVDRILTTIICKQDIVVVDMKVWCIKINSIITCNKINNSLSKEDSHSKQWLS